MCQAENRAVLESLGREEEQEVDRGAVGQAVQNILIVSVQLL